MVSLCVTLSAQAAPKPDPAADRKAFQSYFQNRFPKIALKDYVNGPYPFSASMRAQWKQIIAFPPYQFALDHGDKLFHTPFADGNSYAACFPNHGIGIAQDYPQFDPKTGRVVTLEIAINRCRASNGEHKLKLNRGDMADIAAFMTNASRGKLIDVKIPRNPAARAAYESGKEYFYSRRGQLNFSCASCHVQAAGQHLRGDVVAPALGMTASFPLYRSAWGDTGTLVRRFIGCNEKIRSVPAKADSAAYRDLEYFLTSMSNGLPIAGPGARP